MNQAVIMAGGKGTRLRGVTGDELPKPMASVAGKPILQWQVENLRDNGVKKIILVVGYLGHVIRDYFQDGAQYGVEISYFTEESPLGTAGALPLLSDRLEDNFLLAFGDVIFDVDLERMERFHFAHSALATLFVHPNTHPFDSDLVMVGEDCRVYDFDSKNNVRTGWYDNCVNAGFYMLTRELCERIPGNGTKSDLEKDVLIPLARSGGGVYAYASPEYIKDVGTPQRIAAAAREIESGFVAGRCLKHPQKCIFLDRDGTINQLRGLVSRAEDL